MTDHLSFLKRKTSLRFLASTTSTNDELRKWEEAQAPEGACVIADRQTQGRGRLNRKWHSPPGKNLYLSRLLPFDALFATQTTLLGAVATREAVQFFLPQQVWARIKWPNDIWVAGQKVAGILSETVSSGKKAILGIGINLNLKAFEFPKDLRTPAASLAMLRGKPISRTDFLVCLLNRLDFWSEHARQAPEALSAAYKRFCLTLGKTINLCLPEGVTKATAVGLTSEGFLIVETQDGKRHVLCGTNKIK